MTVLSIVKAVAKNVGVKVPVTAVSSTAEENVKLVLFTEEAAKEIERRVDWGALRATTTITGTGTNDDFALPDGFSRLTRGMAVSRSGVPVRGGLSPDEWAALTAASGTVRFYRLKGATISFFPYPLAAATISVTYQSKFWCSNGTDGWTADTDTALIPEELIIKGAVWRWKRYIGDGFEDHLAEFEQMLDDLSQFDGGTRLP